MKKFYFFISESNSRMNRKQMFLNLDKRMQRTNHFKSSIIKIIGIVLLLLSIIPLGFSQELSYKGKLQYKDTMMLPEFVSPSFADLDEDGDLDLYVGDYDGKILVFTNDGNGNYEAGGYFQADGSDLDIDRFTHLVFADIDGDNDLDLYVGHENSTVKVYKQNSSGEFEYTEILQVDGVNFGVWYNSTPVFADLDKDNDLDLYVGDGHGVIHVCYNNGVGIFEDHDTLDIEGTYIQVANGSSPTFADLDGDNDLDLYVGDNDGVISVFTNNGWGTFTDAGTLQANNTEIDVGTHSQPEFADIDGDGDLDLYVGSEDTTIFVYLNDGSGNLLADGVSKEIVEEIYFTNSGQYSSPVFGDVDGDEDLDLFIGNNAGNVFAYMNEGTGIFSYGGKVQASGGDLEVGDFAGPTFADLDNDDDLDLYVGTMGGDILIFTNNGTGVFTANGTVQADASSLDAGQYSQPTFADIDNDNDLDLYVGESSGRVKIYLNNGGIFTQADNLQAGDTELKLASASSPVFLDFDQDNDLDLFVGDGDGYISVFTNDGTGTFSAPDTLEADGSDIQKSTRSTPAFANLDGSCFPSLYVGGVLGRIFEFEGTDTSDPEITSTHDNDTIYANSNCEALLPNYIKDVIASDNCDSKLDYTQSPVAGTAISGATNLITYTVTDDAGNYDEITFNVAVIDTTPPEITSVHTEQSMTAGESCAILLDYTGDVVAVDNCDSDLEYTQSPEAGTTLLSGDNNVTLFAIDDAGNEDSVIFNVYVQDDIDPVITSTHANQTIAAGADCNGTLPDYTGDLTATDNCDDDLDVTQSPAIGASISGTPNLITLTATDDGGNYAEITFNVEVTDETDPVITCADDATVTAGADGNFTISGTEYDATVTDNCGLATFLNDRNSSASLDGATFAIGVHTIIWTATDDAGNTDNCSVTLTVDAGSTGITDIEEIGVKIYPNPVRDYILIDFKDISIIKEISLFDLVGRRLYVREGQIQNQLQLDMSNYSEGLYFLNIQTNTEMITKKIIKD